MKNYILIIELKKRSMEELAEDFAGVKKSIERLSKGDNMLLFRATDLQQVQYLLRSDKTARQIIEILTRLESTRDDSLLVIECGEDFSGAHFSRAWTWLQRRVKAPAQ